MSPLPMTAVTPFDPAVAPPVVPLFALLDPAMSPAWPPERSALPPVALLR